MKRSIDPRMHFHPDQITVRKLENDDEARVCMDLQQRVWGTSELEVVPHHMFVVARRTGGQALGAFEQDRMVGFLLAFPGIHEGRAYLHSHMTAVLPEYQGQGIGKKLKLAQREDALERGFDLIEWTFDPLQTGNANFNITHLGAIVREYLPNVYGTTTSQLDAGLPTDRLVAEWWIRETRVQQILEGRSPRLSENVRTVRLPRRIREICNSDPKTARQIQAGLRLELEQLFHSSFAVTAFQLEAESATYILEPYENRDDYAARTSHASQDTV